MRENVLVSVSAVLGIVAAVLNIIQVLGHFWTPRWSLVAASLYFVGASIFVIYRVRLGRAAMVNEWHQMAADVCRRSESGDQTATSLLPQYPAYYSLRKRSPRIRRILDGRDPPPAGGIGRALVEEIDRLA